MATRYLLEVPKKQMPYVADMLRYDGCFKVAETSEAYKVHTLSFTDARWRSFGYVPKVLLISRITAKEERGLMAKAIGFTRGIRFAQKLLGGHLGEWLVPLPPRERTSMSLSNHER